VIEVRGVVKAYGYRPVLRGVSLAVGAGEVVTLVGANGAGKSTLLHILATLTPPDYGAVRVAGFDLATQPMEVRRRIGLVAHRTLLYDDLTVAQNLLFFGRMYGVENPAARSRGLMEMLGLWERRDEPVRILSRGLQQRTAVARALVHDPPVLLMDEPDTGLDQRAAEGLLALVQSTGTTRRTVLLAMHNLERAATWGDRVAVLAEGRLTMTEGSVSVAAVGVGG
jgi:heme exporter protein A